MHCVVSGKLLSSLLIPKGRSLYRPHCGWDERNKRCSVQCMGDVNVSPLTELDSNTPSLPAERQSEPGHLSLMENKGFFGVSPLTSLLQSTTSHLGHALLSSASSRLSPSSYGCCKESPRVSSGSPGRERIPNKKMYIWAGPGTHHSWDL